MSQTLLRMTNAMRHRGPNGSGTVEKGRCGLGHTRLAVLDTSQAGAQPMTRDGVTLVYNGELYNFQDERARLAADGIGFSGHSDAEVLLMLYLRHGEGCLHHLRGMYAFAIWDEHRQRLFCARDPLGIKPLLYAETPHGFVFASELKALLASGFVSREVDRSALNALLQRGSVPQPDSILRGVKWLLPGHSLTVSPGARPKVQCFSPLRVNKLDLRQESWPELVSHGERLLIDTIRRQLIADVPLGAFLSGGIDSSLLVALMARAHGSVRTFSVGFETGLSTDSTDETDDAVEVANYIGVSHTKVVVRQSEVAENIREIARGLDHPTVDGVNSWFVARAASKDLTVAISGTGGDELFAGYPWFSAMQEYSVRPWTRRLADQIQGLSFANFFDAQYRIFSPGEAAELCSGPETRIAREDPLRHADTLSRVTGMVLTGYARDQLLADIDTAAMWHGLEVRVPLLDERLLDFALSLPPEAKIGPRDLSAPPGTYAATGAKRLLLEIGAPMLPPDFRQRAKRGFSLPIDGWLRGILAPTLKELLSVETVTRRGLFRADAVKRVLESFQAGTLHWTRPWLLMLTELWAQEVLDG